MMIQLGHTVKESILVSSERRCMIRHKETWFLSTLRELSLLSNKTANHHMEHTSYNRRVVI